MKVYIVENECGSIYLFTKKPKQVVTYAGTKSWAIEGGKGIVLFLNNSLNSERFIDETGNVEHIFLADLIGLKRKRAKNGSLHYEGISRKEPRQVEINIDIRLLNEWGK